MNRLLADVASIEPRGDLATRYAWHGAPAGRDGPTAGIAPAVTIAIAKKPGSNASDITSAITERLDQLQGQLIPDGVRAVPGGAGLGDTILVDRELPETELMEAALSEVAGRKVRISVPERGDRRKLMAQAQRNAIEALERRLAETGTKAKLNRELAEFLELDAAPQRIEVYDNSHIQGTAPIGAMIVAGPEGFMKNAYRKFNIKTEGAAGDDFAMMREVLTRRFERLLKEDPDRETEAWPDLLLIDGGAGQVGAVAQILQVVAHLLSPRWLWRPGGPRGWQSAGNAASSHRRRHVLRRPCPSTR